MATSEDDHVPVRDGFSQHPRHTAPEEMYWLSHMNQDDLKEKYIRLKDDFFTIKKFSCRQEDKIKKLQTKLRKLIADRKKDGSGLSGSISRIQELEHQEAIETQRQSIRELKFKNEHLEKKLKLANVQLSTARKNKPMLFRNVGPRVDSGLKHTRSVSSPNPKHRKRPKSSPPKISSSEDSSSILSPVSIQQDDQVLPDRVRGILEEARERIIGLESERDDIQEQLNEIQQTTEENEYEWQRKINQLEEEVTGLRQELRDRGVREERDSVAIIRAQREAHTLTARSTALQEQIVLTEEKLVAEKSRTSSLQSELEKMGNKLNNLEVQKKEQYQEYQSVKAQLEQITEKYSLLKKENEQLDKENQRLTKLSLAADQRGHAEKVDSLKLQIAQLESALESDLSERGEFLQRLTQDKEEMAKLEVENKELRSRNLELLEQGEKLRKKIDIYDKAGLLNVTQKELNSSRKEKENSTWMTNEEIEKLRQSYSELQLLYREKSLELERTSQTLARHATTYKYLHSEIDRVNQESEQKAQSLNTTIKNLQETIKRRDERGEKLEHQMLMLTDKSIKDKLEGLSQDLTQNVKLSKHDNMLEFHIESITYEVNDFGHLKTFVSWTVPFSLEDPLQHTNVSIGKHARFNYSSLYKFQMNYRNLESLRDDSVTASVYILLESGHPSKIGECQLTFCEVLEHPRNTLHGTVPITVAHDDGDETQHLPPQLQLQDGQVIGTLNYWFRLQRPCEVVISRHLQNVGALSSVQLKDDQLPQKTSNMIKSENLVKNEIPLKSAVLPQPASDTHNEVKSVDFKTRTGQSSISRALPTPRTHSQIPIPTTCQNISEVMSLKKSSKSKRLTDIRSKKTRISDVENEDSLEIVNEPRTNTRQKKIRRSDIEVINEEPSRVSSPSSAGTYNIESPTGREVEVGSPSSTGTYNVESPRMKDDRLSHHVESPLRMNDDRLSHDVESPSRIKDDTLTPDAENPSRVIKEKPTKSVDSPSRTIFERPKSARSRNSKINAEFPGKNVQVTGKNHTSEESDSEEESQIEKKNLKTSSKAPPKPPRNPTRDEDGVSQKSRSSKTGRRQIFKTSINVSEESSFSDSEGNGTMFEESPSISSQELSQDRISEKGRRSAKMSDHRNDDDRRDRKNSKIKSRRGSEVSDRKGKSPFSPSRSSITSDSDGVVAVMPTKSKNKNSKIYIEVCSLSLLNDVSVMQDPLVRFLFVDYHGFLDLPPDQLETPQSLPKPPPGCTINFNFGQEIEVSKRRYPSRRASLEDLMRNRGLIKFTVTSEPPEEMQDTHDCQDLGYAFVNLHDLLNRGQDLEEEDLVVENADDGSGMGTLRITLRILHVLQELDI